MLSRRRYTVLPAASLAGGATVWLFGFAFAKPSVAPPLTLLGLLLFPGPFIASLVRGPHGSTLPLAVIVGIGAVLNALWWGGVALLLDLSRSPLRRRQFIWSGLIGALLTAVAFIVFVLGEWSTATSVPLWPWMILQRALPHPNLGTPEHPLYEGTALDMAAALVGLALSWIFYSSVVYTISAWRRRRAPHYA